MDAPQGPVGLCEQEKDKKRFFRVEEVTKEKKNVRSK